MGPGPVRMTKGPGPVRLAGLLVLGPWDRDHGTWSREAVGTKGPGPMRQALGTRGPGPVRMLGLRDLVP